MVGVFLTGVLAGKIQPFWKRFEDTMDIPSSYFGPSAPLVPGRAVSVSDGDTIRFLHTPTPWSRTQLIKGKEKASSVALPIRICTIDAPETPKFGKPGQPFGLEAKVYLTELLSPTTKVWIRMLQKDQYGRAVADVFVRKRRWLLFRKTIHVDEYMLKAGLAEVYQGGGAVYGPCGKEGYLEMEAQAQKEKVGMWSQGNKRESAADYKRRTK